jgi:uncharacterized protein (TIGR00661 family)
MMNKKLRFLVCPLDWGLGHAARCIPVIHELIRQNADVYIAGSGSSLQLLEMEFPQLVFKKLDNYEIKYQKKGFSAWRFLLAFPTMFNSLKREHRIVKQLASENKIDVIISDNRYGAYSDKVYSILITHQVYIKSFPLLRFTEPVIHYITKKLISNFDACWVPDDYNTDNLSGELSCKETNSHNIIYTGILSRFKKSVNENFAVFEILVVLSGPEPQRTILEKIIIEQLSNYKSVLIVRGITNAPEKKSVGGITTVNNISTEELNFHLLHSSYIICRSGYSSLMDLAATGRSAIIIPTPGQPEQEYLAKYNHSRMRHFSVGQKDFKIEKALQAYNNLKPVLKEMRIQQYVAKLIELVLQRN